MSYLNHITNPNPSLKSKVNYFADYFQYVVDEIEKSDWIDLENHLSLTEKVIYQIENNLSHSPKYLLSYFSHPLFEKNNKYFKAQACYEILVQLIKEYQSAGSASKKNAWITENPNFLSELKDFCADLKKNMLKKAVKAIISYLKCVHDIAEHKDDLFHYTNIIIAEFIHKGYSKKDLKNLFSRILSREIESFPFPKKITKKKNGPDLKNAKEKFINERTFDQQFEGIYNAYLEPHKTYYFLYRVFNIDAKIDFHFKYNQVSFYHPQHPVLAAIKERLSADFMNKDFFLAPNILIASIKVNYYSSETAEELSVRYINDELKFLNQVCDSNAFLEEHSYVITSNYENYGGRWSAKERPHFISEYNEDELKVTLIIF